MVSNTSLDVTVTTFELDGVTVPGSYAGPGDPDSNHTLANDGLVDVYVVWSNAIGGQNITLVDTYGTPLTCEPVGAGDPSPNATWTNVDMTGPSPLTLTVNDGNCL